MSERKGQPLTARSVLASALLGLDPPEASVARLIKLAQLFDINENRTRVALSRMVEAGEATSEGDGRYRLRGRLLHRQARQRVSQTGTTELWNGSWCVVISTGPLATAAERTKRRRVLIDARLGELREGVWMRPANLTVELGAGLDQDVQRLDGMIDGDSAELATRLWDLEAWSNTARELLDRLGSLAPEDASTLAEGFVISASVLRHLQADPLLPGELLPHDWPGSALRESYDVWDRAYRGQLTAWYRAAG